MSERCPWASHIGYKCELPEGHEGDHRATDLDGKSKVGWGSGHRSSYLLPRVPASASDSPWPDQDIVATALGLEEPRMDLGHILKRIEVLRSGSRSAKLEIRTPFGPEGPWRLFVNGFGLADWPPGKAAQADPRAYAEEVMRVLTRALEDSDCASLSDEPPTTDEQGAEAVARLGIDVPKWAAEIREKVAAAQDTPSSGADPLHKRAADWVYFEDHRDEDASCRSLAALLADVRAETIEACANVCDGTAAECEVVELSRTKHIETFEWSARAREAKICAGRIRDLASDTKGKSHE